MTGEILLGALAAFLTVWFLLSGLSAIGHAFPMRPTLLRPGRSRSAAIVLLWTVVAAVAASVVLGGAPIAAYIPFVLVLFLPAWDVFTASPFKKAFVILNATDEAARPVIFKTLVSFFGEVDEDGDVYRSSTKTAEGFQIDVFQERSMVVLQPLFMVQPQQMSRLERLLKDNLRAVKPSGFNLVVFLIAVSLPIVIAAAFGWMSFMLLTSPEQIALRPAQGL